MAEAVADDSAAPFAIRYEDITKSYGATQALRGISLELRAGRVHALVGENGAGKSTFLGIASGRVVPSSGSITIGGTPLAVGRPRAAQDLGVHTIYQELTIIPALTPQANLFLGHERSRLGWLDERRMMTRYTELCRRLHVPVHRIARSGDLSVAEQQMLEIMRAVIGDARALLFDEPTASLGTAERESLFRFIRDLKAEGMAIALVTHNLDEVLENSDDVTVFRDGRVADSRPAAEWTKKDLVDAMLGSTTSTLAVEGFEPESAEGAAEAVDGRRSTSASVAGPPLLRVTGLTSHSAQGIDFELRPGEILGIAGLVGSGRSSLLRALAGLDPRATGTIEIGGRERGVPRSVVEARRLGIALLPEDRKGQGLVLGMSGADNISLGEWGGLTTAGYLRPQRLARAAVAASGPVGFDPARVGAPARTLSGGNQQKLMLSRWVHADHQVLLADEPTRGVDIGAKNQILRALEGIVGERRSMIVVSSELEEVVALSDRVLVVRDGRQIALLDRATDDVTVDGLLRIILGD